MTGDTVIKATDLSCQSGLSYLIKDINWEVKKGEHWMILGANGCGKTTLLSMIAGYKQPTHGQLELFGEAITNENILSVRQRVGFVSASFFDRYYHKESALNIVLSGKCGTFGLASDINYHDVGKAKALLTKLGQGSRIDHPFYTLSKGEQQNVLIARAQMSDPEILVLDEPATGLDILARRQFQSMMDTLEMSEEMTFIYVTHFLEDITEQFEHMLLLKQGQVYRAGLRQEIFNNALLSDFFEQEVEIPQVPIDQSVLQKEMSR